MRRQSIRFSDEEEKHIVHFQKQHRYRSFDQAVSEMVIDHKRLEEKILELSAKLEKHEEPPNTSFSNDSEVDARSNPEPNLCSYRVNNVRDRDGKIRCSRFYLSKGKIIPVDSDFCDHCYELQQKLKTSGILTKSPIPSIYKKPKEIYCYKDGMYLNPSKCLAKCTVCQRQDFKTWAECQRKNMYRSEKASS